MSQILIVNIGRGIRIDLLQKQYEDNITLYVGDNDLVQRQTFLIKD